MNFLAARLQAKANEIEENSKLEVLEQVRSLFFFTHYYTLHIDINYWTSCFKVIIVSESFDPKFQF